VVEEAAAVLWGQEVVEALELDSLTVVGEVLALILALDLLVLIAH
jgi:hypothetical protein